MNVFDYLFEHSFELQKDLIPGPGVQKSYKDISFESAKLASYIRKKIGQQKNILLAAANSPFFIIAYLGILKSGNVCIPLSPQTESKVFKFIAEKTQPEICFISDIVHNHLHPDLFCITERKLYEILNREEEILNFETDFNSTQQAMIMFTSGSTAQPKGVILSHDNIIANTESILDSLHLTESDIMMVVLPFYYCYGLSLLNTHIRVGGSLVLNNNFIFFPQTIQYLNGYRCTGFAGVPSHFQLLLRKTNLFREAKLPWLRYVTQAGGRLHNSFINEFTGIFPQIKFFVMYGQTEATARLSILPPEMLEEKPGSIGKGISGVEIRVINEEEIPVVPGEIGEIIVRGKSVMNGYYDDPESTAEVLKNGWLHTGDLATIDNDGYIYITARSKEIIKIGGIRISPREIEEVIVKMDGVIDCTAEAVYDELFGEAIKVTVVVNDKGRKLTKDEVKRFCGAKLAQYKIPAHIFFKQKLEINNSGKKVVRTAN